MESQPSSVLTRKLKDKSKGPLLRRLPPSIVKLSDRIGLRKVPDDYIKKFLKEVLPRSNPFDEYKEYIFSHEKYSRRRNAIKQKKCKALLNANEQRKLATFKLDPRTTKFITFLPIHEQWKQYMQTILQIKGELPQDLSNVYQKLIKADYHGCMMVVLSSVCPSYVGAEGIVVQETKNVFRLIGKDDKLRTIPKKGSIFCFELYEKAFKIYGDNFCYVPYERIKLKYKIKSIVDP